MSPRTRNRKITKKRRLTAQQRRARKYAVRWVGILLLLLGVMVGLVYVLHMPQLRMRSVQVSQTQLLSSDLIQQRIDLFYFSSWSLLPKDSLFYFRRKQLERDLLHAFDEIEGVHVKRDSFRDIYVEVQERSKEYVFAQNGITYSVDANMVAYRELKDFDSQEVVYSLGDNFTPIIKGEQVYRLDEFAYVGAFIEALQDMGVSVSRVHISNPIEMIVQDVNKVRLLVRPDQSLSASADLLREIIKYKEFKFDDTQSTFGSDLEYINIRHGNKLFYCYTGDSCESNYLIK